MFEINSQKIEMDFSGVFSYWNKTGSNAYYLLLGSRSQPYRQANDIIHVGAHVFKCCLICFVSIYAGTKDSWMALPTASLAGVVGWEQRFVTMNSVWHRIPTLFLSFYLFSINWKAPWAWSVSKSMEIGEVGELLDTPGSAQMYPPWKLF